MLKYSDLKTRPKELQAATGMKPVEIEALRVVFEQAYAEACPAAETVEGQPRQRGKGGGTKGKLSKVEDKLLFILVYQKTYPLQTMLGLQFGLSQGRVNYWIHRLLPVLQTALSKLKMTPEREGKAVRESQLAQEGQADLLIDGSERRRQRPRDEAKQRQHYSGKKTHTDKNLVLVNRHSQKVVYLSATEPGKKHDKKLADEAAIDYPHLTTLGKDTGFQGYEPPNVISWQPKKKPKGQPLSPADCFFNALLASVRITVEHVLSGVKRSRIVKDGFRNTKPGCSDSVMEIACALHNLRVHFRHPIPDCNLLSLTYSSYSE